MQVSHFDGQIRAVQGDLIKAAGIGVVVREIDVAVHGISDGSGQASFARMEADVADQRGRHVSFPQLHLIDFGRDVGIRVICAVIGIAVHRVDGTAVNKGAHSVQVDRANAHRGVVAGRQLDLHDIGDAGDAATRRTHEIGITLLRIRGAGEHEVGLARIERHGTQFREGGEGHFRDPGGTPRDGADHIPVMVGGVRVGVVDDDFCGAAGGEA